MEVYFSHHCYFTLSPKVHCMMGTPKLSELGAHFQFTVPTMLAALSTHSSCVCVLGFIETITLVALPTLQCQLATTV